MFAACIRARIRLLGNVMFPASIRARILLLGNVTFDVRTPAQVSIFLLHVRLMCQSYARFGSISPDTSREASQRKFSIKVLWQVCDLECSTNKDRTSSQSTHLN